jgi:sugar O-acyltransferase (sialic acid O-acetyltransferase NeuD family)
MTSLPLVLVGCGGLGREIRANLQKFQTNFDLVGFIDDTKSGPEILGRIDTHVPIAEAFYLTCFGNGGDRFKIRKMLEQRGAMFANFQYHNLITLACLDDSKNSMFLGMCSISNNATFGSDVLIQGFAVIGHDVVVGNAVTVNSLAFIGGSCVLEDFCTVHPNATVLPHVRIGEGAVVGAGSVVIKDVAPYTTVFGSPAKVIAYGDPNA